MLEGRFAIERGDDRDTIYGKAFDFSGSTMTSLFEKSEAAGSKAYERVVG